MEYKKGQGRPKITDVQKRIWFQRDIEMVEVDVSEPVDDDYMHLLVPDDYGIDALHPGKKVSCSYGQDTIRRVLWFAAFETRLGGHHELVPICGQDACSQPHHMEKISHSLAAYGRLREMTIDELLSDRVANRRVPGVDVPEWAKKSNPLRWSDFTMDGQSGLQVIWAITKGLFGGKKFKARVQDKDRIAGLHVDVQILLGNSSGLGPLRAAWADEDRSGVVEDAIVAGAGTPWYVDKRRLAVQRGKIRDDISVFRFIERETGAPRIVLLDPYESPSWEITWPPLEEGKEEVIPEPE